MDYELRWRPVEDLDERLRQLRRSYGADAAAKYDIGWERIRSDVELRLRFPKCDNNLFWLCYGVNKSPPVEDREMIENMAKARYGI